MKLRESPWYEEIRKEGERSLVLRQLSRKIAVIPTEIQSQIENLTLVQLEDLGEALLEFSNAEDLAQWLNSH